MTTAGGSVVLKPAGSSRLGGYAALGIGGLFAAILTGRPELAALAAPFAVLLVVAVALAAPPALSVTLTTTHDRVLEGDELGGELWLQSDRNVRRVDLLLEVPPGADPVEVVSWSRRIGAGRQALPLRLALAQWGRYDLGPVWVRAHGPLGLVRWEGRADVRVGVRVLPGGAALRALLDPAEPRASAGAHVSRRRGEGVEFAEPRPFRPGDRLRAVNWRVSARRDELWVNEHHPERTADLVLFVDTFADDAAGTSPALRRGVRAAWTVTAAHLDAHDRVGVVLYGGYPAWLPVGGGQRARYALLDRFLAAAPTWSEAPRRVEALAPRALPAGAFVLGVSPLHDERMVTALVSLRRRGLDVALLRVDVSDCFRDRDPMFPRALARYRWAVAQRAETLAAAGVPVVEWPAGDDPVEPLLALRQLRRGALARGRLR